MPQQDTSSDAVQKRSLVTRVAAGVAARFLRWTAASSTIVYEPSDIADTTRHHQPVIFAFWHGQFMLIPAVRPDVPTGVLVARHDDAEILSGALEHFDLTLIRGAGAGARKRDRGGAAALRTSLSALKAGTSIAMTADIPPGPARKLGAGIIALARMSGRPILPAAVASSRFHAFNTWSRLTLNLPLSRVAVTSGDPIYVPRQATPDELEALRLEVEIELNRLTARAYELVGQGDNSKAPITGRPTPPGLIAAVYRGVTRSLEPVGPFILKRRAKRGKEDLSRRNERLGFPEKDRPSGRLAWFHAASVGELNAIRPLLEEVHRRHPTVTLLVTTGTVTSAKIAEAHLSDIAVHQYVPLDGPRMVRRFLEHWRPDVALFVESEIWPNLIYETSAKKIPLVLLNARMSGQSAKAWRKLFRARTAASLFSRFDHILAQSSIDMLRFTRLGSANVALTGNLKIDAAPIGVGTAAQEDFRECVAGRPVFLAASTHPGEEEHVADALDIIRRSDERLLTIIVPRHPERGGDVSAMLEERGIATARRSLGEAISPDTKVYVADTIGEIGLFFSVADVTFMGGSLVPHGGQNPIEPVRLGSPVLTGPHVHNFEAIFGTLEEFDAVKVVSNTAELAEQAMHILSNPERRDLMVVNAEKAFEDLSGALERTLEVIAPYLSGEAVGKDD